METKGSYRLPNGKVIIPANEKEHNLIVRNRTQLQMILRTRLLLKVQQELNRRSIPVKLFSSLTVKWYFAKNEYYYTMPLVNACEQFLSLHARWQKGMKLAGLDPTIIENLDWSRFEEWQAS
jgi:hypothetical protein